MENKEKNGFLITWGVCLVILLTLCYFGVNNSVRGTHAALTKVCAAYSCPNGGTLSGTSCIVNSTTTVQKCETKTQSCSQSAVPSGCTYSGGNTCSCKVCSNVQQVVPGQTYEATCSQYEFIDDGTGSDSGNTTSCQYKTQGECNSVTGKSCVWDGQCYVAPAESEPETGDLRHCSLIKEGVTGGYWGGSCIYSGNDWYCGQCVLACVAGYTREGNACVPCEGNDCESCEEPACYLNGTTYCWGNSDICSGTIVSGITSAANCKASSSSNTPSEPSIPNNPSNPSTPSTPSNPSNPTNPSPGNTNRGPGCYKDISTGKTQWFDSDPEINSSTYKYSVVADSECEGNVSVNPPTGQIAMFIMWVIGLGALVYSVYYFMRNRSVN